MKMILQTERLKLLELTAQDDAFIHALLNSPGWLENIGDRHIHTLADARKYIAEGPATINYKNHIGLWKIERKKDQTPLGLCGLLNRKELEHVDIGFAILPQFYRQGYTFEAAKAVLAYGFQQLKLPTITGITDPANEASKQLLTKIGLHYIKDIDVPNIGVCSYFST
jgi:ribosomal-protein-alanine N-acetyltransferase